MSTFRREGHVILGINALVLGYLPAAWQSPQVPERAFVDRNYWSWLGRTAERGTLDALFLADGPLLSDPAYDANPIRLEPTVNWGQVAAATEHIGLVATASTTFNDPFELAERLLSFDLLSGGRAAWNVVTTRGAAAAANFGMPDVPLRDDRYERAHEFVELVQALWDSAGGGPEVRHQDEFFDLEGRLRLPASPQGRPVVLQAGGSASGRQLAGQRADGVFAAELTHESALKNAALVKSVALEHGRSVDSVRILPGLLVTLGSTEEEARRRSDDLHEAGPASYSAGWLSQAIGFDVSTLDLDERFPDEVLGPLQASGTFTGSIGFRESIIAQIRRTNPTVRDYLRESRYTGSGHGGFVGTPEQLADRIEEWFHTGAIDGFNLQPDVLAETLPVIVDELVPILRRRGLYRWEYTTSTLRGHLAAAAASPLRLRPDPVPAGA